MKARWFVMGALCALLFAAPALAEEADDGRSTAFQAVEGAVEEDVPGGPLLVGAYALVWLGVLGYLVRLVRLQGSADREVSRLEGVLSRGDDAGAAPPQ